MTTQAERLVRIETPVEGIAASMEMESRAAPRDYPVPDSTVDWVVTP